MPRTTKGSVLREVTPYLVEPVYSDFAQDLFSDATTSTKRSIDADPTSVPNLNDLPKWNACPIWDREHPNLLLENNQIKRFIRRARRAISSSSDITLASWRILCILATLRVVSNNSRDHEERTANQRQNKENKILPEDSGSPIQRGHHDDSPSHWWAVLVSENYNDDYERILHATYDDDDDDSDSLLVELWPLIREHIPWQACQRLYLRIQNRLHILTAPHPLTAWAQTSIFELTDEEFETSWKIFQTANVSTDNNTLMLPPNRLHASKLWLDRAANIPQRFVGIVIEDPLEIKLDEQARFLPKVSNKSSEQNCSSSALNLPRSYQSCLPNTCLEIHGSKSATKTAGIENTSKQTEISCRWIALYDLTGTELEYENRTLSTMPKARNCACFQCVFEIDTKRRGCDDTETFTDDKTVEITSSSLAQAQRLAHSYFHQEEFDEAMSIYKQCHHYCTLSNNDTECNMPSSKEKLQWLSYSEADLWHAMGAVLLTQRKFASAQQHWKDGSLYRNTHKELTDQLEKQIAYQYFDPMSECAPTKFSYETVRPLEGNARQIAYKDLATSVFVASNVIDSPTCQQLIDWGVDFAAKNGGWTTSRHYSVPTTDLPVHQVPQLLEWFQQWMPQVLFPLLGDQFGITDNQKQRFYVHDAFLVRYEATSSNRFLPLHFDESTHSCVLALNQDFDGGGSYMYDLKQSVAPSTGGMVSFLGNRCLHGGTPVIRGVRYILAIFLYLDKDLCSGESESQEQEKKTRIESTGDGDQISKRFKTDDGIAAGEGSGGFSFSFF